MSKHKDGFSSYANIPDDRWDSIFSKDKKPNPDTSGGKVDMSQIDNNDKMLTERIQQLEKSLKRANEQIAELKDRSIHLNRVVNQRDGEIEILKQSSE